MLGQILALLIADLVGTALAYVGVGYEPAGSA
jgi:hypothetical protein